MSLLVKRMAVSGIATAVKTSLISNPYPAVAVPAVFEQGSMDRLVPT
jgi:hypothetical protein